MTTQASSRPVGVGVIGLGMIGVDHASILDRLPETELVMVCDSNPERQKDSPARFTSDVSQLLDNADIDAVWVCTPQHTHADLAVAALERGKQVFCEKPIAHSLADADRMIGAAADSGLTLAIGHTMRFHPDLVSIRDAVVTGELGRVATASARWNVPDYEGRILSNRTSLALEMAIHDIDALQWMLGPIVRVFSEASAVTPCGTGPDAIVSLVRFASGAVATLEHNWMLPGESARSIDHRLTVIGEQGAGYFQDFDTPSLVYSTSGSKTYHSSYYAGAYGVPSGALATADRHFVATLRGAADWPVSLEEARSALEVALLLDGSITQGLPLDRAIAG